MITSQVTFKIKVETLWGEKVVVVGSAPILGSWKTPNAFLLETTDATYPQWSGTATLTAGQRVEYKYLRIRADGFHEWEPFEGNRVVTPIQGVRIIADDGTFGSLYPEQTVLAKMAELSALLEGIENRRALFCSTVHRLDKTIHDRRRQRERYATLLEEKKQELRDEKVRLQEYNKRLADLMGEPSGGADPADLVTLTEEGLEDLAKALVRGHQKVTVALAARSPESSDPGPAFLHMNSQLNGHLHRVNGCSSPTQNNSPRPSQFGPHSPASPGLSSSSSSPCSSRGRSPPAFPSSSGSFNGTSSYENVSFATGFVPSRLPSTDKVSPEAFLPTKDLITKARALAVEIAEASKTAAQEVEALREQIEDGELEVKKNEQAVQVLKEKLALLTAETSTLASSTAAAKNQVALYTGELPPGALAAMPTADLESIMLNLTLRVSSVQAVLVRRKEKSRAQAQAISDAGLDCIVCCERPRSIRIGPCGHGVVCSHCATALSTCPMCKRDVVERQPLYLC